MNKALKICIILMLFFVTTGCVKYKEDVKIKNTKSMNINITFALDTSIVDYHIDSTKIDSLKDMGYRIKTYKKDNYEGIELNYKIRNINKVSSNKEVDYSITDIRNQAPTKLFQIKKGWLKNQYKANFYFDSTDIDPLFVNDDTDVLDYLCDDGTLIQVMVGDEIREGCRRVYGYELENAKSKKPLSDEELSNKINEGNELEFKVHLPSKAISHNASSSKHDKVLTWDLSDSGITYINYEFSLINYSHVFITILVILAILFAIRKISLMILKKKKIVIKKKKIVKKK